MKKNLLLAFISLLIVFLTAEVGLRIAGVKPGVNLQSPWFKEVDSLFLKQGFYADINGIFKVSPASRDSVVARIHKAYITTETPQYNGDFEIPEVYSLAQEVIAAKTTDSSPTFNSYIKSLKSAAYLTEADSAIISYAKFSPINEEGFRSIPFKNYSTPKKKVLLLGDSFTWGHSAQAKTNSFADLLLTKGYLVYNTGISGADPAQYLAIAQQYIDILKPDYVIVNFFMGNDVLIQLEKGEVKYFKRTVKPYTPIHYTTNAGNILSCPTGIYFETPNEAYNFVVEQYRISQNTLVNKLLSLTACGTLLWKALHRFNLISNTNSYSWYTEKVNAMLKETPACNDEIKQIEDICNQNKSKFFLVTINDVMYPNTGSPDKYPHLFEGMTYHQSPVKSKGYNDNDGHYNNEGHKTYADFLDGLMRSEEGNR